MLVVAIIIVAGALVFVLKVNNSENEPVKVVENTVSDNSNSYSKIDNSSSIKENNKKETNNKKTSSDIKWEYTELEDGTISLYAYETEEIPETMEVPSVVDGKTVTGIERLFLNEENVKKVILPETLTHIGIDAFMDSVSIEEVEINSIIEHIYGGAFYHCSGIRSLAFPDGLKKIDDTGIFMNTGLEELHVPASVKMTADELSYAVILKSETTIYAPAGSAWETYANKVGYTFSAE